MVVGTPSVVGELASLQLSDPDSAHVELANDMVSRCNTLLAELEQFQSFLKEKKKDTTVDVRGFKTDVETELRRMKTLPLDNSQKCMLSVNCSNIPFLEAMWAAAKQSTGIHTLISIGKRNKVPEHLHKQNTVSTVDIIAGNKLEWVKVSTITERRMIFDLAKSGWVEGDTSDEEGDLESDGLLKVVANIVAVSKSVRVKYRNPSIRLILPRIRMNQCHKEVLKILEKIISLGVILETAEDIPTVPIPLFQALQRMIPDPFHDFSDTLNVDTTLLLAFASDLSHDSVEPKYWHHRMISHQIQMEKQDHLLPSMLWPACKDRKLVCTREAADRALEIVATIATETERRRTALLLDVDPSTKGFTREQRISELQSLSKYDVPKDWQLPIEVIDVDLDKITTKLPLVAEKVSEILRGVNPSVFFFGWWSGYTTITSNRTVAKEVEKLIEDNRVGDEAGPPLWVSAESRSLVGKEKERRGAIPEDMSQ